MNIIECDTQYIHSEVCDLATSKKFFMTFVYGLNEPSDSEKLWKWFGNVSKRLKGAWMVGGFF